MLCADYGDEGILSLDLHSKNGKSVLGVVAGNTFDESIQSFGYGKEATIPFTVDFTPPLIPDVNQATAPVPSIQRHPSPG